jgi:nitrite reductase/ring-hydroxylating ferredoxin subunit
MEVEDATVGVSRRRAFGMCSLGVLGAVGLAACGSDDAAEPSGSPTGAGAAATDGNPESAATPLVKASQVPVGSAVSVQMAGKPVIVSMPVAEAPVAFQAVCPHKFVTVVVKGDTLLCPAHGSIFDMKTGAGTAGPAEGQPLPRVEVKIVNGEIVPA